MSLLAPRMFAAEAAQIHGDANKRRSFLCDRMGYVQLDPTSGARIAPRQMSAATMAQGTSITKH